MEILPYICIRQKHKHLTKSKLWKRIRGLWDVSGKTHRFSRGMKANVESIEVNQDRWKKFHKTFSAFDLNKLTAGCAKDLGLHSQFHGIVKNKSELAKLISSLIYD